MNKTFDIPDGFESLFRNLKDSNKPIMPTKSMTIDELIRCAEHNAKLIEKREGCTK
jgi:hypothetical protein